MTVARLTKRRNKLEKVAVQVMADLQSMTLPAAAAKYGVARQSMYDFMVRHQDEITALHAKATEAAEDWEIASKHFRLGETQTLYGAAKAEVEAAIGTQDKMAAIKTALSALHSAAEELGQLPRPDQNINVKSLLLIRQIDGTDIDVS